MGQIKDKVYDKISTALWGGLDDEQVAESVKLIYARDALSRANLEKGNPGVTVEEIQKTVNNLEKNISPEALRAAENYRTISEEYTQNSIDRGLLDPEDAIEDYARHFVTDYTPDWVFNKGIPTRLRTPYRGYLKQAKGSTKEIRMDSDALLGQFLEVDYDNMIQDFIIKISNMISCVFLSFGSFNS